MAQCACFCESSVAARLRDVEQVKSFFASLVDHKEQRLTREELAELLDERNQPTHVVDEHIETSDILRLLVERKCTMLKYWLRLPNVTTPSARTFFKQSPIDVICGLRTRRPHQQVKIELNGMTMATIESDDRGEIEFTSPFLLPSMLYMEIRFSPVVAEKHGNDLSVKCMTLLSSQNREKLFVSSKNILWQMHPQWRLRMCYYRGLMFDEHSRDWMF